MQLFETICRSELGELWFLLLRLLSRFWGMTDDLFDYWYFFSSFVCYASCRDDPSIPARRDHFLTLFCRSSTCLRLEQRISPIGCKL